MVEKRKKTRSGDFTATMPRKIPMVVKVIGNMNIKNLNIRYM